MSISAALNELRFAVVGTTGHYSRRSDEGAQHHANRYNVPFITREQAVDEASSTMKKVIKLLEDVDCK